MYYARHLKTGKTGDVHKKTWDSVSGTLFVGGSFCWKLESVVLLEFGSLNPNNDNYVPGGKIVFDMEDNSG
jgi:hypothetical protein